MLNMDLEQLSTSCPSLIQQLGLIVLGSLGSIPYQLEYQVGNNFTWKLSLLYFFIQGLISHRDHRVYLHQKCPPTHQPLILQVGEKYVGIYYPSIQGSASIKFCELHQCNILKEYSRLDNQVHRPLLPLLIVKSSTSERFRRLINTTSELKRIKFTIYM